VTLLVVIGWFDVTEGALVATPPKTTAQMATAFSAVLMEHPLKVKDVLGSSSKYL